MNTPISARAARPSLVFALGIAAALALGACSGTGGTQPPATEAPAATPSAATSEGPASPAASPEASPSEASATTDEGSAAAACVVAADGTAGTALDIRGFQFPDATTVQAGGSITWSNRDGAPHTVTFDDDPCTSGTIVGGGAVTVTYTVPGSYAFHCRFHPNMQGTLDVTG